MALDLKFWNWFAKPKEDTTMINTDNKSSAMSFGQEQSAVDKSVYKSYIPEFLYRPYFGYPRGINILQLRKLAKNPYIFSVVKTLYDSVSTIDYNLKERENIEVPQEYLEHKENFMKWIEDPNSNPESFNHLLRMTIKDICELDSGVWVKVFNMAGELTQIYAKDGGAFLMNPDIFGSYQSRADYIKPSSTYSQTFSAQNPTTDVIKNYEYSYANVAAYYQYGYTSSVLPVPYGKREIVYFMQNPRTENIYGQSPMEILSEIILMLIDGYRYNLDFYNRRDVPNGILSLAGIHEDEIAAVRARLNQRHQVEDEFGYTRNVNGAIPITGLPADFVNFNFKPADLEIISQQQWFSKLVWSCFGINANEMGVTDSVNKASSEVQERINTKKALKPLLKLLEYKITNEIMIEAISYTDDNGNNIKIPPLKDYFKFCFDDYDLDNDKKRHDLLEQQIRMGIKTSEMVAEEEGIDLNVLKKYKQEAQEQEMAKFEAQNNAFGKSDSKPEPKPEAKSQDDPYKPIRDRIKEVSKVLKQELEYEEDLEIEAFRSS